MTVQENTKGFVMTANPSIIVLPSATEIFKYDYVYGTGAIDLAKHLHKLAWNPWRVEVDMFTGATERLLVRITGGDEHIAQDLSIMAYKEVAHMAEKIKEFKRMTKRITFGYQVQSVTPVGIMYVSKEYAKLQSNRI